MDLENDTLLDNLCDNINIVPVTTNTQDANTVIIGES